MLTLVVLVATACGGGGGGSGGGAVGEAGTGEEEVARVDRPSAIDGDYFSGTSVLSLDEGAWTFVSGRLRWTGVVEVGDGELVMSGEATCPDPATYTWTERRETLSLAVVEDPCPGRQVLLGKEWKEIEQLGEGTREQTLVTLPSLHFSAYWGTLDVRGASTAELDVFIRQGFEDTGYAYSPTILEGSPGQQLEITVRNPEGEGIYAVQHNFTLVEQDISVDIEPGEEATIGVTFPDEGSLTFYCRRHVDEGQAGALVVG